MRAELAALDDPAERESFSRSVAASAIRAGWLPRFALPLAAAITTWVTFLPCFYFVLVGAPIVDRAARDRRAHAALSGAHGIRVIPVHFPVSGAGLTEVISS